MTESASDGASGGAIGGPMVRVAAVTGEKRSFRDRAVERVARAVAGDRLDKLQQRLEDLEAEVQECRQLNVRLAEVTDLVEQLLLPGRRAGRGAAGRRGREVHPVALSRRHGCEGLPPHRAPEDRDDVPPDDPLGQPRVAGGAGGPAPGTGAPLPLLVHPDRARRRHLRRAVEPAPARRLGPGACGRSRTGRAPRSSATSSSPPPPQEQAARMVEQLASANEGAEVHLVVTAREPLGLFTASWQEYVKNRGVIPMSEYSAEVSEDPSDVWNWRGLDLRLVLERWAPAFPAERVHVLPLPGPGAPRARDLGPVRPARRRRPRLGGPRAELREHLHGRRRGRDPAAGQPPPRRLQLRDRPGHLHPHLPRRRAAGAPWWRAVLALARSGSRRSGGGAGPRSSTSPTHGVRRRGRPLDSLLVPDDLPDRRTPESVTDGEVAAGRRRAGRHDARRRARAAPRAPGPARASWPRRTSASSTPASGWRWSRSTRGCEGS